MAEIEKVMQHAKESMSKAYESLQKEFTRVRTGRAMPSLLDGVLVPHYGNMVPINQVASVSVPDARTITIKPWEKKMIIEIEKAIVHSRPSLTPQNNGETVIINMPPMTEELRKTMVKQVKAEAEEGRIAMRNIRKKCKDSLKHLEDITEDEIKDGEDELQKITDSYIEKVDALMHKKEAEVMEV